MAKQSRGHFQIRYWSPLKPNKLLGSGQIIQIVGLPCAIIKWLRGELRLGLEVWVSPLVTHGLRSEEVRTVICPGNWTTTAKSVKISENLKLLSRTVNICSWMPPGNLKNRWNPCTCLRSEALDQHLCWASRMSVMFMVCRDHNKVVVGAFNPTTQTSSVVDQ